MPATPRSDLDSHAASRRRSSSRSPRPASSCSGASVGRRGRPSPRIRRSRLGSRLQPRPIPDLIRLGDDRDVLRSRLRARRRDVAIRRARSRAGRPGRGDDPRPLLPGHDPRIDRADDADPGPACCPAGRATPAEPLLVYGRLAAWTIDGIARSFPADAALRLIPTTTSTATGSERPGGCVIAAPTAASCTTRRSRPASSSAARRPTAGSSSGRSRARTTATAASCGSSPRRRRRPSASSTSCRLETYLRGRRAGRDAVDLADRRRSRPRPSPPARMPPAACARASRTTTSPTTRRSQVYHGVLGEKAAANAVDRRDRGRRPAQRHRRIANALFHSTGGGATENNENVYVSSTGAKVAGAGQLPARLERSRPRRQRLRRGVARTRRGPRRTYTAAQLSAWFAADARTNVGDADGARPARSRRLGPARSA